MIIVGTLVFGAMIAGMGVLLVYLGSTGPSTIHFAGQTLDSANVGIGAIFLGAVTVVVVILALLRHQYQLAKIGR